LLLNVLSKALRQRIDGFVTLLQSNCFNQIHYRLRDLLRRGEVRFGNLYGDVRSRSEILLLL